MAVRVLLRVRAAWRAKCNTTWRQWRRAGAVRYRANRPGIQSQQ